MFNNLEKTETRAAVSLFRTKSFKTEEKPLRRFTWVIKDRNGARYIGGYYTLDGALFYRGQDGRFVQTFEYPDYLQAKAFCKSQLFRVLGGARRAEREMGRV